MGLVTGDFPPVDPATFMQQPYHERTKVLSRFWAENGFGAPKITAFIYIFKVLILHVGVGVLIATTTSGYGPFETSQWWDQPIIWQKLVVWTMLLEGLGLAGLVGPARRPLQADDGRMLVLPAPGTIRNPPWPGKVPGTAGTDRTGSTSRCTRRWALSCSPAWCCRASTSRGSPRASSHPRR